LILFKFNNMKMMVENEDEEEEEDLNPIKM
jgi:hypothetical protein